MKIKSTSVILLLSLALGLAFISCKNFLNGSDTSDQLKAAIAYANAKAFSIKVTSPEGTGTVSKPAAGEALKKVTDSFEIRFEPLTDYEFLCWKVSSTSLPQGADINDYIQIQDPQSTETTVTLKKELENIVINATVIDRPRVISYSPMTSGILKDSSIVVQFNRDMDTDSIYYTDPEITQLKDEGKIPLSTTLGGVTKYYGYQKVVNGVVETFYKNISIVNNKTDENLASYFNAPVFESPRVLSISANKDKLLDDYTQVLVLLEKNFFYSHNLDENKKKPVTMSGSELWMYQVNNRTDDEALVFQKKNDKDLFAFKLSQTATNALESKTAAPETGTDGTNIATFSFLKNKAGTACAYLDVQLQDVTGGAGPTSSFNIIYERVLESDYTPTGDAENKTGSFAVEYQISTSEDAVYKGDLPLNLPSDGLYRLYFDFADRSGNHLYWPRNAETDGSTKGFYVTKDVTPVAVADLKLSSDNNNNYTLEWTTTSTDYKNAVISWGNNTNSVEELTKGTNSKDFTVSSSDRFDISITYTDYAGNTVVETIPKFLTGYVVENSPSFDKYGILNVFFENDSFSDYGITPKANYSDGSSETVLLTITNTHSKDKQTIISTFSQNESKIEINKSVTIGEYYIAVSDAKPTQRPVIVNSWGSVGSTSYIYFGDFPQTICDHSDNSFYSSETFHNGWYLGNDGYFYEKCVENGYKYKATNDYSIRYTNGRWVKKLKDNSTTYFKVQPIKWRLLNPNASSEEKKILLADIILTASVPYYNSRNNRTLNGDTIYPNNYKYSNIRAYLNGIDNQFVTDGGTRTTDVDIDWTGKGFLQKAFTASAQSLITDTEVDNSARSTNPDENATYWNNNGENQYECDNTTDKIFLLSLQKVTKGEYGFKTTCYADKARIRGTTDYAKANFAFHNIDLTGNDDGGIWWLRCPDNDYFGGLHNSSCTGYINNTAVDDLSEGVVPALCLESLPD